MMNEITIIFLLAPFSALLFLVVWFLYWAAREEVLAIKKRIKENQ